jgi:uncharacterized protein
MNPIHHSVRFPYHIVAVAVVCAAACTGIRAAQTEPAPLTAVTDGASVLSSQTRDSIEFLSRSVLERTGVPLVLVTRPNLGGNDINAEATHLYSGWGIGKKGKDEGALVLVAVQERQIRIEVGYGAEGYMTDAQTSRIIRDIAVPYLAKGNWDAGLKNTMLALSSLVAANYNTTLSGIVGWTNADRTLPATKEVKINPVSIFFIALLVLFLLFTRAGRSILFFMILSSLASGRRSGGGGFGSGGGGGFGGGFGGGMSGGGGASGRF